MRLIVVWVLFLILPILCHATGSEWTAGQAQTVVYSVAGIGLWAFVLDIIDTLKKDIWLMQVEKVKGIKPGFACFFYPVSKKHREIMRFLLKERTLRK